MPVPQRGGSQVQAKPRAKAAPNPAKRAAEPARAHVSAKLILVGAVALLAGAVTVGLATGGRGARLVETVTTAIDNRFGDAGFRLAKVHVQGASAMATPDIIAAAGVYKDQPLLGMDLEELRGRVAKVGWVQDAKIVRLLPDTLVIAVEERKQSAVWQHAGRSVVIDDKGRTIPEADPARFTTLPLVVGAGANVHAHEILPMLAQRPKMLARLEALVRVDDRRWDLRLKDGSLIQLPAVGEEEALIRVEQIDMRSRILDFGFERIDLRNPDVVAVRPRPVTPNLTSPVPGQIVAEGV